MSEKARREAFVQGFEITAVVSAAIATGLALLVTVLLRRVGTSAGFASESEGPELGLPPAGALAPVVVISEAE